MLTEEKREREVSTQPKIDLDQLAAAIANHLPRRIPFAVDLWSAAEVALYLKVTPRQVGDRYAKQEDFPRAIRLPTRGARRGHPLYRAADIVKWAEKYMER